MKSTSGPGTAVPAAAGSSKDREFRRVLAGGMAGAVLEWYDFAIYGILAATVLGPLFFPGSDPTVKLLLALATQGLGFVARPLGGIVFGHLGDKFGRKPMLVVTFVMLGASTAAIGLLPTYGQIGIWATVALLALRLVQGFALGGEFGAAVLLVSEHGEARRRGFWAAWPQAGAPAGTILATVLVSMLIFMLSDAQFDSWGWRLAFLFAIPLLFIGFWIRRGVEESPVFLEARAKAVQATANSDAPAIEHRSSIAAALANPRAVMVGVGVRLGENVAFYVYTIFVIAYGTQSLDFGRGEIILAVTFGSVLQFAGMLGGGAWSDLVGRKTAMITPAVGLAVWAPIFFWLMHFESIPLLYVGVCVGTFLHGMLAGPEAAFIAELFPTSHRYAGASLVFQGSSIIAGAPAPLIAVWLNDRFGVGAVIAYLLITIAVTLTALFLSRETKGVDLESIR